MLSPIVRSMSTVPSLEYRIETGKEYTREARHEVMEHFLG